MSIDLTAKAVDWPRLNRPVAIFDCGIGSYAAVKTVRKLLPKQDILYFADRASFPYGRKGRADLLAILDRTLRYLSTFEPAAILVASNAPSITVLGDLKGLISQPVFGVRPPIRAALETAGSRHVAVLGVKVLVDSPELRAYVDTEAGNKASQVELVDATALVELVESGAFLFEPERTRNTIATVLDELDERCPDVAAMTLSSTHLPWLRSYIEEIRPGCALFDPIEDAVAAIAPLSVAGEGRILTLVTENEEYSVAEFQRMLGQLGVSLTLHAIPPLS